MGASRLLGVIGGGQLGRMIAMAGVPLGVRCRFLDPAPDACAQDLGELICAAYDDEGALARLIDGCDAVTCEFENVPARALDWVASRGVPCRPSAASFRAGQDRVAERELLARCGVRVAPYVAVESEGALREGVRRLGVPCVVKSRRMGYDGKGQAVVRSEGEVERAWGAVGRVPAVVEGFVRFERELSIVAVRGADGAMGYYPLAENVHGDGILRVTRVVPGAHARHEAAAREMAARVMGELGHIGVLTIELFDVGAGLIANEIAPRVHNSGHWSMDGGAASQFENHVRAVMGMPLASCDAAGPSAMVNIIGSAPDLGAVGRIPGAVVHMYGKAPRAGRKIGHVNIVAGDAGELDRRIAEVARIVDAAAG